MASSVPALLIFGVVLVGQCVWTADADSGSFCYDDEECGPQTWGGMCQTGQRQSPIEIPYGLRNYFEATPANLVFNDCYLRFQRFTLKNSGGHTAQAQFRADQTSNCVALGNLTGAPYVFAQLHFHWGSNNNTGAEHTVNNKRFDTSHTTPYVMEAHFVHYRADFDNVTEAVASGNPKALTVLAVFFYIGNRDNYALTPIIRSLASVRSPKAETNGDGLRLSDFFIPSYREVIRFAGYDGSLTTPACSEVVQWRLMLVPMPISEGQLDQFRKLQNEKGKPLVDNNRQTQPLNGRQLEFYRSSIQAAN